MPRTIKIALTTLLIVTAAFIILSACYFSRTRSAIVSRETQHGLNRVDERSVEQRVADLEKYLNSNATTPRVSEVDSRKQYERDLAEIQGIGLVERAGRDFTSRMPDANVERWTIGYFVDTNVVWCDVRYRVPGKDEILQREFGYSREGGTNWGLIWDTNQTQ